MLDFLITNGGGYMIDLCQKNLSKIEQGFQLPSKPEVLTKIQDIINSDVPDLRLLADVIVMDIALSAAILRTINYPLFGFNRSIVDIKQAVMFLGLRKIEAVTASILLKEAFKGNSCISLERFWDNSTDIANAMLFVGNLVRDKVPLETLYTYGLFHDCGIAAMSIKYQDYKDTLIKGNSSSSQSLVEVEEQTYRTNHAVISFYVASSWNLPKDICLLILNHHELKFLTRSKCTQSNCAYATLKIAENIIENTKRMTNSYDWSYIKKDCLAAIGISEEAYKKLEGEYAEHQL